MSKITDFVSKSIIKGYKEDDFIILGKEKIDNSRNHILVLNVDKIEFPVDLQQISCKSIESGARYVLINDENIILLFEVDNGKVTEIADLPNLLNFSDIDGVNNARFFQDIINIRFRGDDRRYIPQISVIAALSFRDVSFHDSLFDDVNVNVENIISKASQITGVDLSSLKPLSLNHLRELITMLKKVDFSPSYCLGEVVYKHVENMFHMEFIPKDLFDYTLALTDSNEPILIQSPFCHIPSKNDYRFNVLSSTSYLNEKFNHEEINVMKAIFYLTGSTNKMVDADSNTKYNNIILAPPLGYKLSSDCMNDHVMPVKVKTIEEIFLIDSLSRLSEGGRLIAFLPPSVLFREGGVRKYISENFKVSAILELKSPLKKTSINMYLIVIDNKTASSTVVRREMMIPEDYSKILMLNQIIECSMKNDEYIAIEQSKLDSNWTRDALCPSFSEVFDGEPIGELFDVITGVFIPRSQYYADGVPSGIVYLGTSNIRSGGLMLDGAQKVSSQYAKVVSQPGDIVIISTGRVGVIASVKDEVFIPNKQMFILRAHDPSKVHDYLARLQKESTHKQILEMCSGTLIKHISVSKLKQVRI